MFATLLWVSACTPAPTGPTPIGPHQHFSGLVNGSHDGAIITTACGGPVWVGRTGHPVGGQTLSVTEDPAGAGDTGSHSSTVFAQTGGSYNVVQFQTYGVTEELPTDIDVPCDGSGTVAFLQCFGIIACLDGAPDVVKVTFVNIAD
jgi:hypothetical protein